MDDVRIIFVLPEGCRDQAEASDIMLNTFESCKGNVTSLSWAEEGRLDNFDFSKTDFVVFQEFKGRLFETLKESKCVRILGAWCLSVCLLEGKSIPNFPWPIYNMAMSDCIVSCSHFPKAKKLELKEKIQLMGGCYTDNLMSANTHLITDTVQSEKYLQAAEAGCKLMISQWVEAVWEANKTRYIHCKSEEFSKFYCLPFHNLTICSTGISDANVRQELAQKIAKHGGVFTGNLNLQTTDILVVFGSKGPLSEKYKAARKIDGIKCVTVHWINDSISKGYALPHDSYKIPKSTSTPSKNDMVNPDFSVMSAIGDNVVQRTTLEETVNAAGGNSTRISPTKRKSPENEALEKLINGLDIKKAKMAGQYLDGCSIFLAGFEAEQREKLCKIVNSSGATRYDDISERLTHIIVGDTSCPEVKIIKSRNYPSSLVSVQWLLDSMEKQRPVDEENYLIRLNECKMEQFSSPLGQKGLHLLRSKRTLTPKELETSTTPTNLRESETDDLVKQYLQPEARELETDTFAQLLQQSNFNTKNMNLSKNSSSASTNKESFTSSQLTEGTNQSASLFYGKKFILVHFTQEELPMLKENIESACGSIMPKTYKGIPDYVVVPMFLKVPIQETALEVVNNLWVFESLQEEMEVPISYYHRPLVLDDVKPLQNCIVTISSYTNYERNFLKALIEELGGVSQEQFARVTCEERNVFASTHLVSLEADGKKYKAALKWGLPVVNKDWLLECAKMGRKVSEKDYLVGEAKAPEKDMSTSGSTPSTSTASKNHSETLTSKVPTPNTSKFNGLPTLNGSLNQEKSSETLPSKIILTPVNQRFNFSEKTPINQRLFQNVKDTPDVCSQVTPVNKIMEEIRKTNLLGTPERPPIPKTWFNVDTPPSPFFQGIDPNMSPKSKKEILRYINQIPDFKPLPAVRRNSTPLSEVKRRCWNKLLGVESPNQFPEDQSQAPVSNVEMNQIRSVNEEKHDMNLENHDSSTCSSKMDTQSLFINTKLKQLEDMVNASGGNRRNSNVFQSTVPVANAEIEESQPFTVGWAYSEEEPKIQKPKVRIFILSGIENELRQEFVEKIENLGAQVSDLASYDPNCTHLICHKPARNEKTLACMAAGKWILHTSYIEKSVAAGRFLNEEEFEFGNPRASGNIKITLDKENSLRVQAVHWWRKEIARRGYGAFNDMRAIVVANKRDPITRVIEAGGGIIIDVKPPFDDTVHATHCLLEPRSVPDLSVYNPLAQQGIYCVSTLYISDYLYRTNKDIREAILTHFSDFYSHT